MSQVLDVATNVSNPLMVAGFLSGAFFLVLRQILRKEIFPSLTKQLSANVIKLIIDRLFTLSLVALVLGFAGFVINLYVTSGNGEASSPSSSTLQSIDVQRIDEEIKFRLSKVPNYIKKSKQAENPVAKANLTSNVFQLAAADWAKPLFPEFKGKSIMSLVYELRENAVGAEAKSLDEAYQLLARMEKESRVKFYVHDMYKFDIQKLKQVEEVAQSYYEELLRLRPSWGT